MRFLENFVTYLMPNLFLMFQKVPSTEALKVCTVSIVKVFV